MAAGRGHRDAILAGAAVPGVELVHVGHGELQPLLREVAAKAGAAARNHWIGYEEARLPDLYRSWDVFLFPASGSDQGQRAILEALASGVPIVAVDVPGVRDLVADGREAFVVSGREGMREAVERLARDPDLRRAMGARGRERALAFQAKEFARKAAEFYEEAMRRAPESSDRHFRRPFARALELLQHFRGVRRRAHLRVRRPDAPVRPDQVADPGRDLRVRRFARVVSQPETPVRVAQQREGEGELLGEPGVRILVVEGSAEHFGVLLLEIDV